MAHKSLTGSQLERSKECLIKINLIINPELVIPSNELNWRFSRSSGSGGQNINKTDTRVELSFNIENSRVLNSNQKDQIAKQLEGMIIKDTITVVTQEHRTQYKNRMLALIRLKMIIEKALRALPKTRKATKPTKSSQKKRLDTKKRIGEKKQNRSKKTINEAF